MSDITTTFYGSEDIEARIHDILLGLGDLADAVVCSHDIKTDAFGNSAGTMVIRLVPDYVEDATVSEDEVLALAREVNRSIALKAEETKEIMGLAGLCCCCDECGCTVKGGDEACAKDTGQAKPWYENVGEKRDSLADVLSILEGIRKALKK